MGIFQGLEGSGSYFESGLCGSVGAVHCRVYDFRGK